MRGGEEASNAMRASARQIEAYPPSAAYAALATRAWGAVREPVTDPYGFPYSERHLRCVWFDPAFRPPSLRTHAGEEILVVDPGRWNLETGPDFMDAVLLAGPEKRRLTGDVEIHVRPSGWTQHGHRDDPRYARVIAHVSYFPGILPQGHLPPAAVQVSLRNDLTANPFFSFENVDVTAYPYASRSRSTPCRNALAERSPADVEAFLESAGAERLRVKAERLVMAIRERGPEQTLYEEVLCALGYKQNRVPFRQLARRLPLEELREEAAGDVTTAYAVLAGISGLLPARIGAGWDPESRAYARRIWDLWWKRGTRLELRVMPREAWALAGVRPPNHPLRRLMAAAALFAGPSELGTRLLEREGDTAEEWLRKVSRLLQPSAPDGYWLHHYTFSGRRSEAAVGLIGPGRIAAMIGNVILPWVTASEPERLPAAGLLPRLPPEDDNALVRRAAHALLGADHNPALYRTGLRQQGFLQVFHDFCLNDRSGCAECPLPQALRSGFGQAP